MESQELTDETAVRVRVLVAEYVELVDLMRNGQSAKAKASRGLSSQRTRVHNELIRLTGLTDVKSRAVLLGTSGYAL